MAGTDNPATVKFYGMQQCPTCNQLECALDGRGIPWECIDISQLANLRSFLHVRDADPQFDPIKQAGGIGIPCVVRADGSCTLDWQGELGIPDEEVLDEQAAMDAQAAKRGSAAGQAGPGQACQLGGGGC